MLNGILLLESSQVIAAQAGTKWMSKEEAAGNIYQAYPKSVEQILGEMRFAPILT